MDLFYYGAMIGFASGFIAAKLFNQWQVLKDVKVRSLTHQLQDADNTIETLSREKAELQDKIIQLKDYQTALRNEVMV